MKTKQTSTPWVKSETTVVTQTAIRDKNNNVIARVLGEGMDFKKTRADTEFIIRAVNKHDDLVQALHVCLWYLLEEKNAIKSNASRPPLSRVLTMIEHIKKALTSVGGK